MTQTTLEARIVGMLAPATGTDAAVLAGSDQVITEALTRHRRQHVDVPLMWTPSIGPSGRLQYLYGWVPDSWGVFRATTDAASPQVDNGFTRIIDGRGNALTGWALSEDGYVTFAADQSTFGTHYFSAYGYDVYASAAEVAEWMIANRAQLFDFTVGAADTYTVSQVVAQLERLAALYRSRALPVRVRRRRGDTPTYPHHRRSRAGNDL